MESPGSFLRKTSDAWEKQNDTKTIDELTIESLGRGRTSGFLGTNHSTANATFAPRQAAGSTLVSRQRGSAIFREARELIAETFLRRVLPRRGVESNAALKRGVSCQRWGRSQPARLSNTVRYQIGKERYKFSSESLARFSTCAWLY